MENVKNMRKIRIHMVNDWKEYAKDYLMEGLSDDNGESKIKEIKESNVWHILLSNCHKYSNWFEIAIDNCIEHGRTELMIMDDM